MNMRKIIEADVYFSPNKLAEMMVDGKFPVNLPGADKHDRLAAALVLWAAGEAEEFVDFENEDDWPLIGLIAELAAMAMLARHDAEAWAAERVRLDADGAVEQIQQGTVP